MKLDIQKFTEGLHDYISRAFRPLNERLRALEERRPEVDKAYVDKELEGLSEDIYTRINRIDTELADLSQFKGEKGDPGNDGKHAYDIAVSLGFEGSVDDWMESLKGKDGADGADGKDGLDGQSITVEDVWPRVESEIAKWQLEFERRAQDVIQKAIDKIPAPRDGRDGRDGKDGRDAFDLEDIELAMSEDNRTLKLCFMRGEEKVERFVKFAHLLHRETWKPGKYLKGDVVTWGGSTWAAKRDTDSKPETDDSWALFAKKGRDGRQGKEGPPGPRGPKGERA